MKLYENRYLIEICDNGIDLKYCIIYKKFFNRLYLISKKIYINKLNNKLKITTFQN